MPFAPELTGGNQCYDNILLDGNNVTDTGGNRVEVFHDYGVTSYNNPYDYFEIADYNLLWRTDSNPVLIGGNEALFSSEISLSEWQLGLETAGVPLAARQTHSIESNPEFVDLANDDYRLADNGQAALTASHSGGPVGCYITGAEEIGLRSNPSY